MTDAKVTIERELELIDGMIEVQLHHAEQCDRIANRTMAEKQKGWDMERVALLRKMRAALEAQPAEPCMDTTLRNAARRSAKIVDRGRMVKPVEPVAWMRKRDNEFALRRTLDNVMHEDHFDWTPIYAAPPIPVAVPLTDERIVELFRETFLAHTDPLGKDNMTIAFARAIERAHSIAAAGDKT